MHLLVNIQDIIQSFIEHVMGLGLGQLTDNLSTLSEQKSKTFAGDGISKIRKRIRAPCENLFELGANAKHFSGVLTFFSEL